MSVLAGCAGCGGWLGCGCRCAGVAVGIVSVLAGCAGCGGWLGCGCRSRGGLPTHGHRGTRLNLVRIDDDRRLAVPLALLIDQELTDQAGPFHRGADGGGSCWCIGGHLEVEVLADWCLGLVDGVAVGVDDLPVTGGIAHGEGQRLLCATKADRTDELASHTAVRWTGHTDLGHLAYRCIQRCAGVRGAGEIVVETFYGFRRRGRSHLAELAVIHVVEKGKSGT